MHIQTPTQGFHNVLFHTAFHLPTDQRVTFEYPFLFTRASLQGMQSTVYGGHEDKRVQVMVYLDGECGSGGGGKGSKGVMWERDEGCWLWSGVGDEEGEEEQEVEHVGTMCPSEAGGVS